MGEHVNLFIKIESDETYMWYVLDLQISKPAQHNYLKLAIESTTVTKALCLKRTYPFLSL